MIRVRIAPSPTGLAHLGTAYTALFNYAFSQKNRGRFILRIEDTDKTRYVAGSEKVIYEGLLWLGLKYDEGPDIGGPHKPYTQSKRLTFYKKHALELVEKDKAYFCFCSEERLRQLREKLKKEKKPPMYDGLCRKLSQKEAKKRVDGGESYVIRLKVPQSGKTEFIDEVRGKIVVENKAIDDQVLLKSDGFPTYHLAVVVDDYLMKISHVIRGEEWLSSTPKHVLLYRAFGWPLPKYVHLPLLRNPDRSKVSKRKNPVSLLWYREQGYLPEALLNYFALLGWSHPKEKEIFSLQEFIQNFDIKRIHLLGPVFDLKKLDYLNGYYIRHISDEKLAQLIKPYLKDSYQLDKFRKLLPLIKERLFKLNQINEKVSFLFKLPDYSKSLFIGKKPKEILLKVKEELEGLKSWQKQQIYKVIREIFDKNDFQKKEFYVNLYLAIEGKVSGLPLFESMEVLGKKETLSRLNKAIEKL